MRLSSGKRINSVGDDAAGFSLARGLESRSRSLQQALANVGNAMNVLSIAEGGYLAIADLLQIIKVKTVQGADDAYSSNQRAAIQKQIDALVAEIDAIVSETTFQGLRLIDGTYIGKVFQTGAGAGDTMDISLDDASTAVLFDGPIAELIIVAGVNDRVVFNEGGGDLIATIPAGTYLLDDLATELEDALDAASTASSPPVRYSVSYNSSTGKYTIGRSTSTDVTFKWTHSTSGGLAGLLGFNTNGDDTLDAPGDTAVSDNDVTDASLSVANATNAANAMTRVEAAMAILNKAAQSVGEILTRLASKESTLTVAILNTGTARSRIEDTDFAQEYLFLIRDQIIQQTAFSALSQANVAPQLVLSFFQ